MSILEKYKDYEAVIGMEVHVQLNTESKIFCSCPNKFGQEPNTNICPICAGYPGTLPVLNKKVLDYAIKAGLATKCKITKLSKFARKHYMYPDLPKNYQITQDEFPICTEGHITITLPDNSEKNINIIRIHMEEDAGKNIHATEQESYVDLNRTGTPLLEIVSYPDMSNSCEVTEYLTQLKSIVEYLGISDANMEEGSFRGDVNISIRKKGDPKLGTKVELKNINSFKFISNAIDYEIERQVNLLESGEKIEQETRLWDNKKNQTFFMRSKEEAHDYRYLLDPDLPLLNIDDNWIERLRKEIPELAHEKYNRFQKAFNISGYESKILVSDKKLANFFEQVINITKSPKITCNWILRDLLAYLKDNKLELKDSKITSELFAQLIIAIDKKIINSKIAQEIFLELAQTGKSPDVIIKEKNLTQIESSEELEKIVKKVIEDNPEQVKQYLSGKIQIFGFLVGACMKETKGKGNPVLIQDLLKKNL